MPCERSAYLKINKIYKNQNRNIFIKIPIAMTYSKFYKLFFKVSISAVVKLVLKYLVYSSQNSWGAQGRARERYEGECELEDGKNGNWEDRAEQGKENLIY